MFEQATASRPRSAATDWIFRASIAAVFVIFGSEKFGASWTVFFQRLGWGDWFRYFTGVVEIAGALLLLIP